MRDVRAGPPKFLGHELSSLALCLPMRIGKWIVDEV